MGRVVMLIAALILVFGSQTVSLAGEGEVRGNEKTTWNDILSDIVGHYPIKSDMPADSTAAQKPTLNETRNWEFDMGMQRFLMSHTSYEIGNNDAPFQKPLSRLEFPLNTWWLDFRLRRTCPRWSIGQRAGFSVAKNTDGRFKDSDWERAASPETLTTYSESACRAEANYLFRTDVDVNISDWLRLPKCIEIRPLFAFQFQRLNLMAHDGVQWTTGIFDEDDDMALDNQIDSLTQDLSGDTIHFRQDYYMYQIGLRGSYEILKAGKYVTLKLNGEADWGPVLGYNEDHHLKREGDLFGYIKSSGNSMYFSTSLDMVIAKAITAGITMDYLWIRTTGIERHSNIPKKEDSSFPDGVKVWSDQTSLIAHVSYAF